MVSCLTFINIFANVDHMIKKITHRVYQYTAVFEPDSNTSGFTVTIPALPGCISEGNNFEEALENIQEAASLYIEVMQKREGEIMREATGFMLSIITVLLSRITIRI